MPSVNYDWVKEQLQKARATTAEKKLVKIMLEAWEGVEGVDLANSQRALEMFAKLALGHPVVVEQTVDEIWVPALPGQIKIGDEVRVLADAYEGKLGPIHNGRRGRIIAIRSGDVIVTSTDGLEPKLDGAHYAPYKLEKRVR